MTFLLLQKMIYAPAFGGANKANRSLMQSLAQKGNLCHVIAPACGSNGTKTPAEFRNHLKKQGIRPVCDDSNVCVFQEAGVEVNSLFRSAGTLDFARKKIDELKPDFVLVSSEDPGQVWLELALHCAPGRVIYLVHTPLQLPFGPEAFFPSVERTELLKRAAGIVTVSKYLKNYIKRWSGLDSEVLRFPVYSRATPLRPPSKNGYVTLVNPCSYKGISIFLDLAIQMPDVAFAAVPTWGTNLQDLKMLEKQKNIRILAPSEDIDDIFEHTRILMMPSLWLEAFGLLAVEAMLRGIPVIASDVGGLPEAKLGVEYVLPVNPIRSYSQQFDEREYPLPILPEQDLAPWEQACRRLLSDPDHYGELAATSRFAASEFAAAATAEPFESYFRSLAHGAPLIPEDAAGRRWAVGGSNTNARALSDPLSLKKRSVLQLRALRLNGTRNGASDGIALPHLPQ
jgi:glycosyltransferase involved in cell wall biosynthesis